MMKEYDFPWPNSIKGYELFPIELENDSLVLFHGTAENNLEPILNNGFKAFPPLESVSYAKKSIYALGHVCRSRGNEAAENSIVIAVRFKSINVRGININNSDIHVYDQSIQPDIIGYCVVPNNYQHV